VNLNLVGKAKNLSWGCEAMIWRAFEALGHHVSFADVSDASILHLGAADLNVIIQGYGLSMVALHTLREHSAAPVVCWHAEVMSPTWPTDDPVVLAKADWLSRNAAAYDLLVHNCSCCLETVKALGARRVAWCSSSGVDAMVHRRLDVPKLWDIGCYGWRSPRRLHWIQDVMACLPGGLTYAWPDAREGRCYGEQLVEFINQCKVTLNVHFSDTKNTETRIYESLGCGVPVVSEPISMPELFPDGWGVTYGETPEALAQQIQAVLELPRPVYLDLCATGSRRVHHEMSYQARCAQFLETVAKVLG
jgi:spore maturation protein CgeB